MQSSEYFFIYPNIYCKNLLFIFNIKELYTDTKPDKTTYYHDYAS